MVAKFNGHVYNYSTKIRATAFYRLKTGEMLQNWHQGGTIGLVITHPKSGRIDIPWP
jgi:hypothetical protein